FKARFVEQPADRDRLGLNPHAPRFKLAEVQKILHHTQQVFGGAGDLRDSHVKWPGVSRQDWLLDDPQRPLCMTLWASFGFLRLVTGLWIEHVVAGLTFETRSP